MNSSRFLPLPFALLLASGLAAQGQTILFSLTGSTNGLTAHLTQSAFYLRAGSATGSHVATVPLDPGMDEPQIAPLLIPAAAQQHMGVSAVGSPPAGFRLDTVDGAAPSRGCLFGTDDLGVQGFVAEITGGGTSRFFGAAFPKATASFPTAGTFSIEVVGASTTDGHLFGVFRQIPIAAGDSAATVNTRIVTTLQAAGCSVFDVAMPSFVGTGTVAGLGVDRFEGQSGAQVGHSFRVSKILALWNGSAQRMARVAGLGWFPTGGFAEYGQGHANSGAPPYLRGDGDFAPGGSYHVVAEFGRPTVGFLATAVDRTAQPLPWGGDLLVDPATLLDLAPIVAHGRGAALVPVQTPNDPALLGQTLHRQAFGWNPTGPVSTSGLYLRVWS